MKMLRSQIDEERAKVNNGPHWAAGAEGPITKFDPHSQFARNIIKKKKPAPKETTKKDSQRNSARSAQQVEPPTPEMKPVQPSEPIQPEKVSPKKRKVEIVVEKQAGALWGYNHDVGITPGNDDDDEDVPRQGGGALWGPPPDERENAKAFQEELQRQRSERKAEQKQTVEEEEAENDSPPPPKQGGALWGPPPDEKAEAEKFRKAVERIRGGDQKVDENGIPLPIEVEKTSAAADASTRPEQRPQPKPTGFTYFDMLVNKDIMDDVRYIDKQ